MKVTQLSSRKIDAKAKFWIGGRLRYHRLPDPKIEIRGSSDEGILWTHICLGGSFSSL